LEDTVNAADSSAQVLDFWFGEDDLPAAEREKFSARWFARDDAFDERIRSRFSALIDAAIAGELDGWQQSPSSWLALLLLLDQFPRNIHRDSAMAFAGDVRAQRIALAGIARGDDQAIPAERRAFAYLPLEHSEDLSLQQHSVRLFDALAAVGESPDARYVQYLDYARRHWDVIRRFGRFPHRNKVLGRTSTPEEQAYLDAGGGF
jgi:uncharacterized protein (DUF924 family)